MKKSSPFCTVEDVKRFTGVKLSHLKAKSEEELDSSIEDWIKQSESLIKEYCNNDFSKYNPLPDAVQNICMRLTANMVTQAIARRDTPITKVNDWNISTVGSRIFTNDLKEDIAPYRIDKSYVSDKIDFFAITGADLDG